MKKTTVTGLEEKWEVFLVYILGFLGFIFSFLKYDYLSENIKFHYKQSGTIWLVYVIFSFIAKIFGSILGGAVFAYIYRKTGNITNTMVLHAFNNLVALMALLGTMH